jgi:hypothetical protein
MKSLVPGVVAVVAMSVLSAVGCTVSSRTTTGPSGTPGELPPGQSSSPTVIYPGAAPAYTNRTTCEAAGGVWNGLLNTCTLPR